jgi:hypothetical protein
MTIDTINLNSRSEVDEEQLLSLASSLENGKVIIDKKTGWLNVKGYLENLRVQASLVGCYVSGSVPRFLYSSNAQLLKWRDLELFINALNDNMPFVWDDARVTRLDLTYNLHTSESPTSYFPFLDSYPKLKRNQHKNTLYFGSQSNQMNIAIYDKVKEAAAKGFQLSSNSNYLRPEVRMNKPDYIQRFGVNASKDLLKPEVHRRLTSFWFDTMNSIKTVNPFNMDLKQISTPKQLDDAFKALYADEYTRLLETTHLAGGLNAKRAIGRSKSRLIEVKQKYLKTPSNEIEELNRLLLDAYVFQLNTLDSYNAQQRA